MDNDPASVTEQRANAVAGLRCAAPLLRKKDGRHPPMHIEAVSDGERSQQDEDDDQDIIEPLQPDLSPDSPPNHKPTTPEPSASGRKRRSRSRSCSRGSRDFKGKEPPTTPRNDSSPNGSPPSPSPTVLQSPSVVAPIPS